MIVVEISQCFTERGCFNEQKLSFFCNAFKNEIYQPLGADEEHIYGEHQLAVIHNKRFGGNVNAERVAVLGVFHDAPEIITGDMPTPVKYYSKQIREAYNCVEDDACKALLEMIPEDIREEYKPFFIKQEADRQLWKFVKAADKICAYTKCIEESKAGNHDFDKAAKTNLKGLEALDMPEVKCFMEDFLPSYSLTLDDMN